MSRTPKTRKKRRTQKDFQFYSQDEIIDLTGEDENGERVPSGDAEVQTDLKIKCEIPEEGAELTGKEPFIRNSHVSMENINEALGKQVKTEFIDNIVKGKLQNIFTAALI